ncbi:sulfatase family protein [Pontiella agarivorans]|uniref:Sulfatase n=1 Tax=Pontiella agarivorans TaxID=3038953 RepID=A0ABU5MX74_9BACT|nr:sulfatase [Pontiella agarivorans]MDZ8118777.1 sulfatase [Pontiella agarivorans]
MKITQVKNLMAVLVLSSLTLSVMAAPKNFVIILADDQGYEDLSCFGSKRIESPNIDQLAREGMRMTQFYTASSVCTPSRAGLLTGRMPKRAGVPRVLSPFRGSEGMPPSEITLAELLKEKGYTTGIIGKWHLGHMQKYLPLNQGFDSWFGLPYSNDMTIAAELKFSPNLKLNNGYTQEMLQNDLKLYLKKYQEYKGTMPLMRGHEVIEYPVDQTQLTKRYTEEAVQFIHENKEKPFFLYLAHSMPHRPIYTSEPFKGSGADLYSDCIQEIDWSVGEVIKALKETGLDKETFVIYTSDNGPAGMGGPEAGSAGPLRGKKFQTFEGGLRVPTVIWAPGEVPAGMVCDEMVSTLDLFPTLAAYAGAALPKDRIYDGYDVRRLLSGETTKSPRHEIYYYEANLPDMDGIRVGDWKFLYKGDRDLSKFRKNMKPRNFKPMLFNLKDDPAERNNLYSAYPEKVEELKKQMDAFDATIQPSS